MTFLPAGAGLVTVGFFPKLYGLINLPSKFKERPYKSPKRSETWHGAHIGHEKSYGGVKIDLKGHFQGQKGQK